MLIRHIINEDYRMIDNNNSVEVDLEIIKQNIKAIHACSFKVDAAIDKMLTVSNDINNMLVKHDGRLINHTAQITDIKVAMTERKTVFDKQIEYLDKKILEMKNEMNVNRDKYHAEVMHAIAEVSKNHTVLADRIRSLESWRWYIMGAAAVIGFIIAKIPIIF